MSSSPEVMVMVIISATPVPEVSASRTYSYALHHWVPLVKHALFPI